SPAAGPITINSSLTSTGTITASALTFFFDGTGTHRDLHSFPTRRSSDLINSGANVTLQDVTLNSQLSTAVDLGMQSLTFNGGTLERKSTRPNSSQLTSSCGVITGEKRTVAAGTMAISSGNEKFLDGGRHL